MNLAAPDGKRERFSVLNNIRNSVVQPRRLNARLDPAVAPLNDNILSSDSNVNRVTIRPRENNKLARLEEGGEDLGNVILKEAERSEMIFKGYNHDKSHNEYSHTDEDNVHFNATHTLMMQMMKDFQTPNFASNHGWTSVENEGITSYSRFNSNDECGEGFAMCEINALPAQVMPEHLDKQSNPNSNLKLIEKSMASRLIYGYYPQGMYGISDRDALFRCVTKILLDGTILEVGRSVADVIKQPVKNVVRAEIQAAGMLVIEKEGSDGKVSVVCKLNRINPKFSLSFMNSIASEFSSKSIAEPLLEVKNNVEKLLKEYKISSAISSHLNLARIEEREQNGRGIVGIGS